MRGFPVESPVPFHRLWARPQISMRSYKLPMQFKLRMQTSLEFQKLAKRDGGQIDRNRDIEHLWKFYQRYKRRHRLEDIQREEQRLRESGTFSANFGELEVALLLIVYIAYGYTDGGAVSYFLLTLSSWFLVISWLFAPYIFNPSGFEWQKTVEDFDDWTSWLLYKGGVGVKGENSWESWWDEEQMHIQTLRGRILETILSLRFFLFQYGIVYKLHLTGKDTSLAIYGFSWVVLITIVMIFKVFTFNHKKSAKFQLVMRFTQGVTSLGLVAAIVLLVVFTRLSIADLFACLLAIIPTGWAILCLAITWKRIVKSLGLWDSVREFARMYDAGMGMLIFSPIAFLSWFPFISTFQSRLLFNQAFSRGLEISLILAGNKANVDV